MLKRTILFLITMMFSFSSFASGIRGYIKNQAGEPLSYATIFIEKTGTGTVSNEEGYFEVDVEPGNYRVLFQYLGYEAKVQTINVTSGKMVVQNITLSEQTLELAIVEITDGREDPAYTIMRKAIAKADYHRQQIDSYVAKVYIKGSGRLLKSPKIVRKALEKEGVDSTQAFLVESVSEISYERPNTFKERVISIRQQGDNNSTSPNAYINGSFYESNVGEAVSPLSTKAFAYYKFEFLGSYIERDVEVNKIKVIPRSRGEGVFEGTISIVDQWWNIHSLDLVSYKLGVEFNIRQIYAPIQEKAWLPVTHRFLIDGKFFGFRFVYDYLATVSDYQIEVNPDLDVDFKVIDEKIEKELAAEIEKSKKTKTGSIQEKLEAGDELTRKDLRKLIKQYEKEEREQQDEPDLVENTTMEIDSNAYNQDTAFWEKVRPVPLTKYEVKSYRQADSIAIVEKKKEEADGNERAVKKKRSGLEWSDLIMGGYYKLGEKTSLSYESPLLGLNFNSVEGWVLEVPIKLRYKMNDAQSLTVGGIPRFSLGREKLIVRGFLQYKYGKEFRRGLWAVEGGRAVPQLNEQKPIAPIINSVYTLLFEKNFLKAYEKDFTKLKFRQQLSDNFHFAASAEWARRRLLENADVDPLFDKKNRAFTSNTPYNAEIGHTGFAEHEAFLLRASFDWQPWQRYKMHNGQKIFIADSPLFFGKYSKGFDNVLGSDIDYDLVEAGFKYVWNRHDGSRLDGKIAMGIFLNNDSLMLSDFRHFPGNRTELVTSDPVESFRLLDYYEFSTQDKYLQVHLHYQFRKLLFTQIPDVWLLGLKENLFVNYLATPASQNYFEVGYGLDNILKFFRIEAVTAFQDFKYQSFGIRIGISSSIGVNISGNDEEEQKTLTLGL